MDFLFRSRSWVLLYACVFATAAHLSAAELFKPNDVVAFVGGEDMVAGPEYGELELLITTALPDHKLKFRSLAWEGDTVYEQHRDVNYPKLEEQLETIGATAVICQFGAMESFDGEEKLPEFLAAYKKLLQRLTENGKRRAIVLPPWDFDQSPPLARSDRPWASSTPTVERRAVLRRYQDAITGLQGKTFRVVDVSDLGMDDADLQRDGIHLTGAGHVALAAAYALKEGFPPDVRPVSKKKDRTRLRQLIIEKNRLWFHYYRPQNWAFLAGDRMNQPSSRDHRDPSKRWFPEELEQFLPLIEQKEQQIHALAKEISK